VKKEELQMKIGQRIVDLRLQKGWSQADLARACGKDRQSLERMENGKVTPSVYSIFEITKALEISMSKFFNF
jgi:transcriptional regulator with XRE-family HTH domain